MVCPQCKIAAFFVKNEEGERALVYINEQKKVVPKYPEQSLDGFDCSIVYCLGCSWKGSPKRVIARY